MCRCRRRLSTLSTLSAHRCRVCTYPISFLSFLSLAQVCVRETQTRPKAGLKVRLALAVTYSFFFSHLDMCRLSEASKMLRRLEKGLNNAKLKSQTLETSTSTSPTDWRMRSGETRTRSPGRYSSDLPRLNLPASFDGDDRTNPKVRSATDDEENDSEGKQDGMFPADLIRRENQRHSFFKTILNPSHENPTTSLRSDRSNSTASSQATNSPIVHALRDPVSAGILDESNAKVLFDLVFLRLNPFVNLFDPALHTTDYVRSKSPFLFTVLIMAGCKFFKPESFKPCQKLAHEFAVRAFADGWKSVEVVQAFACLTYWKEPEDTVSSPNAFKLFFDSRCRSERGCTLAWCVISAVMRPSGRHNLCRLAACPSNWGSTGIYRRHLRMRRSYSSGSVAIASALTSYCLCMTGA